MLPDEETGRVMHARVPGHDTRPARPGEQGWWQEIPAADVLPAIAAGHAVATEAAVRSRWDHVTDDVRRSMRDAAERVEAREVRERERRASPTTRSFPGSRGTAGAVRGEG